MEIKEILANVRTKMEGSVAALRKEFSGIRTGRASPNLLDTVLVESYGQKVQLKQVANISVPEPKVILIQVWDRGIVKNAVKSIAESGLGLTPMCEGQTIRIILPDLTEERRRELAKSLSKYAEKAKVAVRNNRREGIDELKKMEKNKELTDDEVKKYSADIQKITDEFVKNIDDMTSKKEKEIMSI